MPCLNAATLACSVLASEMSLQPRLCKQAVAVLVGDMRAEIQQALGMLGGAFQPTIKTTTTLMLHARNHSSIVGYVFTTYCIELRASLNIRYSQW